MISEELLRKIEASAEAIGGFYWENSEVQELISTIQELQGEIDRKDKVIREFTETVTNLRGKNTDLQAENDRLKDALKRIKTYKESFTKTPNDRFLYNGVVYEATEALKEKADGA